MRVGDRVVFLPMGGVWGALAWMTGVISKKNKDPVWQYEVQIDYPSLLREPWDFCRNNDEEYSATVSGSGLALLKRFPKTELQKLNGGLGPDGLPKDESFLLAFKITWDAIWVMNHKDLKKYKKELEGLTPKERKPGTVKLYKKIMSELKDSRQYAEKQSEKYRSKLAALVKKKKRKTEV